MQAIVQNGCGAADVWRPGFTVRREDHHVLMDHHVFTGSAVWGDCGLVGSSLYLAVVVISLALGALLRKTAAGLSVFAAVFFVAPIVVGAPRRTSRGSRPTCRPTPAGPCGAVRWAPRMR